MPRPDIARPSAGGLVLMQSREFLGWVLAANATALPAAYVLAGRWLRGFAYRIDPGVMPALLAALFSLTVAYKAVQAARANPVDSLKYERPPARPANRSGRPADS